MDSTLNDFLKEINEIAPIKTTSKQHDWKECFDDKSGFSYYWNTETDEVTWEKPEGFIPSENSKSKTTKPSVYPAGLPTIRNHVSDPVKIYKLSSNCNSQVFSTAKKSGSSKIQPPRIPPRKFRKPSDSDEEKITLISSYGSESESESEDVKSSNIAESLQNETKSQQSDDEETDILSTVRKRAEELKMLGQADMRNIPKKVEEPNVVSQPSKPPISGFSLVAGYNSDSEEEEYEKPDETEDVIPEPQKIELPTVEEKKFSHSTLFPIVKPPDVNDFIEKQEAPIVIPESKLPDNSFDVKNFKRKRRLGISFVSTQKSNSSAPFPTVLDGERKGFGFSDSNTNSDNSVSKASKSFYSNFTSGGVEFTKQAEEDEKSKDKESDNINMDQIKKIYEILHEKLAFLCEGNKDVMPVQIILIQIETLFGALKANSLEPSYLHEWLEGTSEDLIKLEKEAAPEGWLLQWDRSQKRYYYHNQSTGEGRWEYPQSDGVQQEEAMDICTTPPPPQIEEPPVPPVEERPPLPPPRVLKSPTPPPPPIISGPDPQKLPEPPSAPKITVYDGSSEPLPPGVDYSESIDYKPVKLVSEIPATTVSETQTNTLPAETKDIDSAFDSFYSELAAIESVPNVPSPSSAAEQALTTEAILETTLMEPPKKKKKKVKMGQGLSMKKKDVSKLVEKWKNVQKNY